MQFDYGKTKAPVSRMVFLGLVLISPAFLAGLNQMYVAIALPQMKLNLTDASWFGSLSAFSAPISCALVGFLIDRLGRRAVLLYSLTASVIGWSLLLSDYSPSLILLGQMFNGLTTGTVGYASQVYAGECIMVGNVRMRNSFLMWNGVGGSIGSTTTLLLANFINYRQISAICTLLSIALLVLLYRVIPESPTWLYCKGRLGDAEWAARKLGIAQPVLLADATTTKMPTVCLSSSINWSMLKSGVKKFSRRDVYKPVAIFTSVNMLLAMSGPSTLLTYMINIIENNVPGTSNNDSSVIIPNFPVPYVPHYVGPPRFTPYSSPLPPAEALMLSTNVNLTTAVGSGITSPVLGSSTPKYVPTAANMCSVIIGVLMCITALTSCVLLPYFGIRNILTTSQFCSSFGFLVLAFTTIGDSTPEVLTWRVMAISTIAVLYSLSSGSSDSVLGDVLPADAKGFASVVSVCSFLAAATTNKAFPFLFASVGGHVYVLFTAVCILSVYFIRFFMPEVSGKTLDQINREFLKV